MLHFYTPWKRQKIKDFLTFPGGVEMEHWVKMGSTITDTWYNVNDFVNEPINFL